MSYDNIVTGGNNQNTPAVKPKTLMEAMNGLPCNQTIADNFVRAWAIINRSYQNVVATISGGSDSDVVLDIVHRADRDNKVEYVWIDTGLEYQATKDHLKDIEAKYGISITRIRPKKPIPLAVKETGQPFLNKRVSEYIYRLQKHGFDWTDGDFDDLLKKYPKCKSALAWWCNANISDLMNIRHNKWLKEFMMSHKPTFRISNKCCNYAKKSVIHNIIKEKNVDLNIFGVRKAEGGIRATAYKSCFGCKDTEDGSYDEYRPIWWYKNEDKEEYCKALNVEHSRCYTEYGLTRTGCVGCPFGRDFEFELEVVKKFEPKLYKAVTNIFGDSYAYTRAYREFVKAKNGKKDTEEINDFRQLTIFDVFPDLANIS